jgi:hypothetical protein
MGREILYQSETGCVYMQPISFVGFEVFTAATMKNAVFWDVNRRFSGKCGLHIQVRRNNASEEKCYTVANRLTVFLLPRRWRRRVPPKRRFIINPRGATFQKTAFFLLT